MNIDITSMKIYDISMKISSDMPVYKGKESKRPSIIVESDFATGTAYESRISMNLHTGTHIDRPLHILPEGDTMDTLNLSQVVTACKVLDLSKVEGKIGRSDLMEQKISEGDFILLRTKNSLYPILEKEFIYLDQSGSEYLHERKIKGVGIDSLGIERNQPGHETHKILLGANIVILEGLMLKDVEAGEYLLIAAPLSISGTEAAPVRAMLLQ